MEARKILIPISVITNDKDTCSFECSGYTEGYTEAPVQSTVQVAWRACKYFDQALYLMANFTHPTRCDGCIKAYELK